MLDLNDDLSVNKTKPLYISPWLLMYTDGSLLSSLWTLYFEWNNRYSHKKKLFCMIEWTLNKYVWVNWGTSKNNFHHKVN